MTADVAKSLKAASLLSVDYQCTHIRSVRSEKKVIVGQRTHACIRPRLPETEELRPKRDAGCEGPIFREGNDDARAKEHGHKAEMIV